MGEEIAWNVEDDPNALLVGHTGSGKSVCLVNLAMQALLRGWQVGVIDTVKYLADFSEIEPWAPLSARNLYEAAQAVNWVYGEVGRRQKTLASRGVSKTSELHGSTGEPPFLLIIEEYYSMVIQALPDIHYNTVDSALKNAIQNMLTRILREGRFVDVHVVLSSQRPDANVFKGEIKSNLGFRVLAGASDPIARQMVFKNPHSAPMPHKGAEGRAVVESSVMDAREVQLYNVATSKHDTSGAPIPSKVFTGEWDADTPSSPEQSEKIGA
jgi:S-DNA-T family DNA segregation ATPase FtsK/SpoIIIE